MRMTDKRFPIVAAILAALFLCTITTPVQAAPPPFDAQNCMQNMQNALTRNAQDRGANSTKIFKAGELISSKMVYCFQSIILPIWQALGLLESIGTGSIFSAIGTVIWNAAQSLLLSIVSTLINQICNAAIGMVTAAISFLNSLLCLPMPHFNLNFNLSTGFAGGSCNGISILGLAGALGGTRRAIPGAWGIWGLNRQY